MGSGLAEGVSLGHQVNVFRQDAFVRRRIIGVESGPCRRLPSVAQAAARPERAVARADVDCELHLTPQPRTELLRHRGDVIDVDTLVLSPAGSSVHR
jgi:hypothetical protein